LVLLPPPPPEDSVGATSFLTLEAPPPPPPLVLAVLANAKACFIFPILLTNPLKAVTPVPVTALLTELAKFTKLINTLCIFDVSTSRLGITLPQLISLTSPLCYFNSAIKLS